MLRGNRLYVLALGLIFLVSAGVSWTLLPRPPEFANHDELKAKVRAYQPGGSNCKPEALARLGADKAVSERDRCAEAAEQYRLDTDDLMQQTRAADGAQVGAFVGYQGLLMVYLGTLFSFGTLLTAIAAVWFAKRAADAAEKSISLSLDTAHAELRAYIATKEETFSIQSDKPSRFDIFIQLVNCGSTPAHELRVDVSTHFIFKNGGVNHIRTSKFLNGTTGPQVPVDLRFSINVDAESLAGLQAAKGRIMIELTANYINTFNQRWRYEHLMSLPKHALADGRLRTENSSQYRVEDDEQSDEAAQAQLL